MAPPPPPPPPAATPEDAFLSINNDEVSSQSSSSSSSSSWTKTMPMPRTRRRRRVCVMDASGPLGSALVHRLLHRGYTVHAASFPHPLPLAEMQRLCSSIGVGVGVGDPNSRLKVFRYDPLDYHSILDALKGCCGLFYSFEPFPDSDSYNDEFMAEMEVRAAHNVLEACAQTHTMHKVVFTSSATAVIWRDRTSPQSPRHDHVDENNWSNANFCRKYKLWHGLSKTLAETTAWALAMDRGVNMVSINGGLLMTPDLTIATPYLKGAAEMYQDGVFVTVDLRFLLDSHICVFEDISAYGRYLSFNHVIDCNEEAVKLAHRLLPPDHDHDHDHIHAPSSPLRSSTSEGESRKSHQQRISNKKLKKLMVDFDTTTPTPEYQVNDNASEFKE